MLGLRPLKESVDFVQFEILERERCFVDASFPFFFYITLLMPERDDTTTTNAVTTICSICFAGTPTLMKWEERHGGRNEDGSICAGHR